MTYESKSFKEHHLTRLPVLERLLLLGWEREQIICPSPNSDDTEWHVPKTPSEATNRESKRSFKGYPVDIALFDDVEFVNDYEHIVAIIECKEPNKNEGISQLKIYLGLEPHARLGIWTNGTEFVRVYKLPSAGDFKVVEGAGLPKPTENFILAGDKRITYSDLQIPSTRELKSAFSSLLGVLTSRDTRSTRREDQLNQMSNILLIKLESDHMDKMTQILDIPSIKNDTNFWMVRAKRGFFFDEFIRNEFIAIGWNSVTKAMISQNLTRSQSDRLKASIKATYDESKPGTSLNKCIRFCYELKAGDIAVIVDNNRVAFAYIGEYYEEQSPTLTVELEKEVHQQIEKANPNTDTFTCPYIKRRKITLIKVLTADDTISPYLQSAIARNWHSLSDLNEYAELVLSGCFDTVLFKDKLTVTFRVKRKEEINVLDLANFVLCAARLLSDDKPETVQVKTTLHSPGDVILQIWNFAQENAFPLLICYMAIFGGKARDYEFHSIIGVIKGIINHKYDEDKKKIELRKLSAEADLAEQQALKQKLENIETMRRLQLSSVDAYAEPLATAAKNLAVQPSSATIIDITKILKSQQEDQPPQ